MKNALIAAVVAAVVAAASSTAATLIVTSANIKNGTIQTVDISAKAKQALKGSRGPRGFRGAVGIAGTTGATGPQGPPGIQSLTRVAIWTEVEPETFTTITAPCPAGQIAVSGGHAFPGEVWESQQKQTGADGWTATGANLSATESFTLYVTALCSPNIRVTGPGLAATTRLQHAQFARAASARVRGGR